MNFTQFLDLIFIFFCSGAWISAGGYVAILDVAVAENGCIFKPSNLNLKIIFSMIICGPGYWITAIFLEVGGVVGMKIYQCKIARNAAAKNWKNVFQEKRTNKTVKLTRK